MKSLTLQETQEPNLYKLVDRNNDWQYYYHKPTNQYLRAVSFILDSGLIKGAGFYRYLLNATKEDAEKKLRSSGNRGTRIHRAISMIMDNGGIYKRDEFVVLDPETNQLVSLTDDEWYSMLAFERFWNDHEPILLDSEFPVYNLKVGYAGTADQCVILTKQCDTKTCECKDFIGLEAIPDYKTGSGIYRNYRAQIALYVHGDNLKGRGYSPKVGFNVRLGTKHKRGYEIEWYNEEQIEAGWIDALSANTIQLNDPDYKPFDPQKDIYETSEEIKLKITKKPIIEEPKKKKGRKKKEEVKPEPRIIRETNYQATPLALLDHLKAEANAMASEGNLTRMGFKVMYAENISNLTPEEWGNLADYLVLLEDKQEQRIKTDTNETFLKLKNEVEKIKHNKATHEKWFIEHKDEVWKLSPEQIVELTKHAQSLIKTKKEKP